MLVAGVTGLLGFGLVGLVPVGVAVADTTGTTTASVTLVGGVLAITVPADAGSLGTANTSVNGVTISGSLGAVQVTDDRSAPAGAGWVASAVSTAFAPATGPAIPATQIGYVVGQATKVGTATYTGTDATDLSVVQDVLTATAITGNNSATWNPTISVRVPPGLAAGTYSGTITHSVA